MSELSYFGHWCLPLSVSGALRAGAALSWGGVPGLRKASRRLPFVLTQQNGQIN
jgi:hypothetical protein